MAGLFREARQTSHAALAVWTALQSLAIWTVALAVVPFLVVQVEREFGVPAFSFAGQRPLAALLFIGFSGLNASAGAAMVRWGKGTPLPTACAPRLVVRGPYAHLRNPMAAFGLGQGVAVALGLGSWGMLGVVVLVGIGWHVSVRPAEEADLARRLGADYEAYRGVVRCWVPRLRPYRPPGGSSVSP